LSLTGCERQAPEHRLVGPHGELIMIPVKDVNDGGVHFYTYKYEEKNINFFTRMDGKGRLHTHYDACYGCYKYKKGYRVEGSKIRCIACNLTYDLKEEVWDFIGPCSPIPLRSRVKGGFIIIKRKVIERGKKLF
jgi:uncharacterized membrane protein